MLLAYCDYGTLRDPAIPSDRAISSDRDPRDPRDPFRSNTWSGLSPLVCASQIGDVLVLLEHMLPLVLLASLGHEPCRLEHDGPRLFDPTLNVNPTVRIVPKARTPFPTPD